METKEVVEGALLAALVTVIIIIGFFLPMLGNILLILSPLPIIIAVTRWNSRLGIIISLVSAIILFILINPGLFLFAIFYTGLLGVSLGAAFDEGFKPKIIIGIGTIAAASSFLLTFFVVQYVLHTNITAQLTEQINIVAQNYKQLGFSAEVTNQVSEQLIRTLKTTFPTLMLCSGLLIAILNYYFSINVLSKLNFNYPYQLKIEKFKLSKLLILGYLLALLFNNIFFDNLYILLTFLFSLQGLAVAYHFYTTKEVSKWYLIVAILFFPLIINLLFFIGIFDLWFDFRNLDDA
ncbi:DUF2232 domain-containing protein [Halanaerobacter jeridensis]|uniref:Uncharacterized protein YybS (DUF2232 family) n=1 Tax=Halanaerobacter jeridensis TaxID=706427 RepID=A0A938XTK1_9FIRM|nr:DUF2232 domain-containing protein [Halanaerobacter jeridensis]MBM7557609.1 uncharacterized protein YybS (DUF2232 family) [Halanaerobacter jeridensis]